MTCNSAKDGSIDSKIDLIWNWKFSMEKQIQWMMLMFQPIEKLVEKLAGIDPKVILNMNETGLFLKIFLQKQFH